MASSISFSFLDFFEGCGVFLYLFVMQPLKRETYLYVIINSEGRVLALIKPHELSPSFYAL